MRDEIIRATRWIAFWVALGIAGLVAIDEFADYNTGPYSHGVCPGFCGGNR